MKMAGVPAFDCGAPSRSKARGRWHARVTDRESAAGVENGRPALTEPVEDFFNSLLERENRTIA